MTDYDMYLGIYARVIAGGEFASNADAAIDRRIAVAMGAYDAKRMLPPRGLGAFDAALKQMKDAKVNRRLDEVVDGDVRVISGDDDD